MIRAVLDTNVIVSGILSGKGCSGKNPQCLARRSVSSGDVPRAFLEELRRVLRYPKISRRHGWSDARILEFVEDVTSLATLAPGELRLTGSCRGSIGRPLPRMRCRRANSMNWLRKREFFIKRTVVSEHSRTHLEFGGTLVRVLKRKVAIPVGVRFVYKRLPGRSPEKCD